MTTVRSGWETVLIIVVLGRFRTEKSAGCINSKDMLSSSSLTVVVAVRVELGVTTGNVGVEGCLVRRVVGGRTITNGIAVIELLRVVRGESKSKTTEVGIVGVGVFVIGAIIVIWVADMLMKDTSVDRHCVKDDLWHLSVLSSWDISVESILNCVEDSLWDLSLSDFLLDVEGLSCFFSISGHWNLFV